MTGLADLGVSSLASYAIAVLLPAFDALVPVLPSETAVIAPGVATAGSADPRAGVLVALAASGAFPGDNAAYLLGRASAWPPEAGSSSASAARAGARGPSDPCAVSAPASSSAAGSDLPVSGRVFRSLRIKLQPPPATLAARATSSAVTGAASSW